MRRMLLVLTVLFVIAPALTASGEAGAGQASPARFSIHGRVVDATDAPIAGARVTAVPDHQRSGPSTVTDGRGEFIVTVDPGRYVIKVVAEGFLEASQGLSAPQTGATSLKFMLEIAGIREAITVSAPAGDRAQPFSSATKTPTPLRDVPQSVTVVTQELMRDQLMMSIGDVVRYVPGITAHQGENNRDQIIIRGNSSSADFFVNGVRDDVQY